MNANSGLIYPDLSYEIVDFLIDDKIILELKTVPFLLPIHFKQVKSYLKVKKLKLGILANFRGKSLVYKRILNSEVNL